MSISGRCWPAPACIAVGFGAQTLVWDVFSGLFFLIDDAFRVGEYIVIVDTSNIPEAAGPAVAAAAQEAVVKSEEAAPKGADSP
ncbi:MAG: mechanosensitive ion channel family protein [Rhodospirillales bacterium]|nr:mechanosensitive ion channel family protein [Rhodospirillales bacterium]